MTETEVEEKTEFKFSELSDAAKETARDKLRHSEGYLYDDWWDFVYEDFITMAGLIGFATEAKQIWFSGFGSQGDGASFAGEYRAPKESAVAAVADHASQDEELAGIAGTLDMLNVTTLLQYNDTWATKIVRSGYYVHSGGMSCDSVRLDHIDDELVSQEDFDGAEEVIQQAARDLADWLYKRLEEENDWLYSDECVDEHLADCLFDETGVLI